MKKFRFLLPLIFLLALFTVVIPGTPSVGRSQPARSEVRGVWLTSNDMDTWRDRAKVQQAVTQLRQLNFNTIYPVVWNGGYATYPSTVTQRHKIQDFTYKGLEGQDILADLISQAHAQGLLVMPWFEFGFMAPPTSELAIQHPDWLTQKRDGEQTSISAAGEVVWLNPFHPEVQKFMTDLVLEVVTQYDVDGIQFDDHTSLPSEFGYDAYTIALYTRETKKAPPANAQDPTWIKWRADKITAFMHRLHQSVSARKPKAIFSVSPNYYDFAYKLQLQDWLSWVRRNIADEIIVQVYRPDLQSFLPQLTRPEIQESQKKIPTAIGIMTGLRNRPAPMWLIQSQVRAAQERGLGVSFFYFETLWTSTAEDPALRKSGFQALFPAPSGRSPFSSHTKGRYRRCWDDVTFMI